MHMDEPPNHAKRRPWVAAIVAAAALATLPTMTAAAEEDPRMAVTLPPEVRTAFLEHMRHHMDALDDIIAAMAKADFARAAKTAKSELAIGGGLGFGRFMPVEFREMGMAMHRSAADFADVAAAMPAQPSAGDWQRATAALADISAQCRSCHATFRVE